MSTIIKEMYDALLEAGVSEEKASKAAAAITLYDTRFTALEQRMTALEGRMARLEWMVGTNIALTFGLLATLIGFLVK